jgi:hypothetical protein
MGKLRRGNILPLPEKTGQAIADYQMISLL